MTQRAKAMIALVLIAPLLTEITSGNTPIHKLLDGRIALFLLLAYGFPLLVIPELSARWRLGLAGALLLGLAYGFLNEGLLAQTLIRATHVPIDRFDRYILFAGFNLSWMCLIVPWHAFLAVLFPIALVSHWFPECAHEPWLSRRAFGALSLILIALLAFLALVRTPHPQMLACGAAILLLTWLARRARSPKSFPTAPWPRPVSAFLFGLGSYLLFFLGLIFLAAIRVRPWVYFAAFAALSWILWAQARARGFLNPPAAARTALGAYFAAAVFNLLAAIAHHSLETAITASLLIAAFAALALFRPLTASHPKGLPA